MNIPPSLSNFLPLTSTLLHTQRLSPNWTEKLICELFCSPFSSIRLNQLFGLNIPVLLTACKSKVKKEPSWPRQGVSAWARTLAYVQVTNLVTKVGASVVVILWIAQNTEKMSPSHQKSLPDSINLYLTLLMNKWISDMFSLLHFWSCITLYPTSLS